MSRLLPALLALALVLPPAVREARAQVRRCELPDGQTVYTDKRCDAIGAAERRIPPPGQAQFRNYRAACARTMRDLYFEVSAALESRDVNRLAAVYHWPGMSTRQGYDVMRRLQVIVDRPLVDLQPVWPGGDDGAYVPGRLPTAFRIEQTAANGSTPMRATLGVRRHLDCWWVTLDGAARPAPPRPGIPLEMAPAPVLAEETPDPDAGTPSID